MIRGFKSNPKDFTSTPKNPVEKSANSNSSQSFNSFERETSRQDFVVDWQMKPGSHRQNIV